MRPRTGILFDVQRRAFAETFFRYPSDLAYSLALEFTFYGVYQFFCRIFSHFEIGAHDEHWHITGFYHCLRGCDDLALYPAAFAAALPRAVFPSLSVFGNFGMLVDDDVPGYGHLVAAVDLVDGRSYHLLHLQPV